MGRGVGCEYGPIAPAGGGVGRRVCFLGLLGRNLFCLNLFFGGRELARLLIVWIVGVWQVFHGLSVGTWNVFLLYIARFYMRLDSMSRMVAATQRAAAAAQRVFGVMDREATVQ